MSPHCSIALFTPLLTNSSVSSVKPAGTAATVPRIPSDSTFLSLSKCWERHRGAGHSPRSHTAAPYASMRTCEWEKKLLALDSTKVVEKSGLNTTTGPEPDMPPDM
jgi:hypothetical protein